MTSALSPIWGTHFGDTKLVVSTTGKPASANRSIKLTFVSVGTMAFSFCRPSRGPTSTIFTEDDNWRRACADDRKSSLDFRRVKNGASGAENVEGNKDE